MAQSDLDRNLAATPYKLEKAREKGQVPKSPDVSAAVVFTAAMLFLTWQGWSSCREQFRLGHALLSQAPLLDAVPTRLWALVVHMIRATLFLTLPFLLMLVVAAVASNILQTGPVFSFHPIKPDWERISPAKGFKRVFSVRTLFVGARAMLKLVLLGSVSYYALKNLLPQFYHLASLSPLGLLRALLEDFASLGMKIALMLGLIAIIDLLYTKYEFAKNMRMSHRDMKDEVKHREGDPRIRARLRELRREMLKRSLALRKTRHADVLITNPTHVAVALRYVHGQMASPQLLAKGSGFMAAAMRQIAARHHIPVVQNPSLARTLYRDLPVDQHVPPELYAQVARIIVWVLARRDAMREQRGQGASRPVSHVSLAVDLNRGGAWIS